MTVNPYFNFFKSIKIVGCTIYNRSYSLVCICACISLSSIPCSNFISNYTIKNTLSAKYRIKLVLAPATFVNWRDTVLLPNKFNATLSYRELNGKKKSVDVAKNYITAPSREKLDTITLIPANAAEGEDYFTFPVNEYNLSSQETTVTQLQIQGKVSARESGFDRVLRIEQVFLEPVTEE